MRITPPDGYTISIHTSYSCVGEYVWACSWRQVSVASGFSVTEESALLDAQWACAWHKADRKRVE